MKPRISYVLPHVLEAALINACEDWSRNSGTERLWARDAALWSGADEPRWLGWLDVIGRQQALVGEYRAFAADVRQAGFRHALLLGMGGSSLGPEVLARTYAQVAGFPELRVLDSTDPAQVAAVERSVDLHSTLVVVASKSGSTLEPNVFKQYFHDRMVATVGASEAGARFVAITDPGSNLEKLARQEGFRRIFHGEPGIGGRYSVLSAFGMVPAALMGLDVERWLATARSMADACAPGGAPEDNPGVLLGLLMGTAACQGRDKLTLIPSPGIHDLGAWLEQLIAESTGKDGRAVIPVDREPAGSPLAYGADRLFVYMRLDDEADPAQDALVSALEHAGHPVVRIGIADRAQLPAEFFRWEIATAVAGALLAINPFDQPDVEASKVETRKLMDAFEREGRLPQEEPVLRVDTLALFADARNAGALAGAVAAGTPLAWLRAHLHRLGPGDYLGLLAYIEMNPQHEALLNDIRALVRDSRRVATCLGFGPRFLHSTGQAYKGGPDSGVFLQITCDDAADLPVPGSRYTFGAVKAAQARGDLHVLSDRGRRALRVHLQSDVRQGLIVLRDLVAQAVA